jgi:hypothetical protein
MVMTAPNDSPSKASPAARLVVALLGETRIGSAWVGVRPVPSSTMPLQSLSSESHSSTAPGKMPPFASSQSSPQPSGAVGSAVVPRAATPSPSASTWPSLDVHAPSAQASTVQGSPSSQLGPRFSSQRFSELQTAIPH